MHRTVNEQRLIEGQRNDVRVTIDLLRDRNIRDRVVGHQLPDGTEELHRDVLKTKYLLTLPHVSEDIEVRMLLETAHEDQKNRQRAAAPAAP